MAKTKFAIISDIVKNWDGGLSQKTLFHSTSKSILRLLVKALNLKKGEYVLRSNVGGCGVLGEITLHTNTHYIQICGFYANYGNVLIRTCQGMHDYHGGPNNWAIITELDDMGKFVERLKNL